jgi:cyclomaltodextrinase / maltogenic alpha-amylase / neopullulanase
VHRDEPDWVKDAIWWQVFPMGFTGADMSGRNREPAMRLRHIESWLDYALQLGASGILLGPIFTSTSHGYDTADYYEIDPRLGDEADFRSLVDAAHERGMKVLLDGVFNHVGTEFAQYQDALAGGPQSPFAQWFHLTWPDTNVPQAPEHEAFEGHEDLVVLNHDSDAVAKFVGDVMCHWLARGADGWRLDAAYAVIPTFWDRVLPTVRERFSEAYFVGEVIHGDYATIVSESGLDSVTQYELWKAIWSSINDANFFELAWSLERHNEYLAQFVPLTFLGNHDVTRVASKITEEVHLAHALVILLLVGGTPSIYYGDEQAFRGIKEERFGGDDEIRPTFPGSPDLLAQFGWPTYRLHQQLIGLRRRHRWLHDATTEQIELTNEQLLFRVSGHGESLLVALNLANDEWRFSAHEHVELVAGSDNIEVGHFGPEVTVGPHGWAVLAPVMIG